MEEFKKDLLKVCGKNTAALIIFFVLGGVFLAFGLLMWITAYDPFDAQTDGYATMEVTYVMGPFAELTSDGKAHTEFYIAEDSEGYWSIIATKGETSLPVYGVDVDDTDLDSLPAHTIRGKAPACLLRQLIIWWIIFLIPDWTLLLTTMTSTLVTIIWIPHTPPLKTALYSM